MDHVKQAATSSSHKPAVDLFWSFRSPYSYLATPEAVQLPKEFAIDLQFRPVFPIAIRDPSIIFSQNPLDLLRIKYIRMDWERRADMLGLPHAWPDPDPVQQDPKTFSVPAEQPYIFRLSYLGVEANRLGRGVEFGEQVSRLIFGGTKNWHLGDLLEQATARAGLNLAEMEQQIERNPQFYRDTVERNQDALKAADHWGVPTFVYRGEPFFGQDRIDSLRWKLTQDGLRINRG